MSGTLFYLVFSMVVTDEALKEVQSELQVQKKWNDMFMFLLDREMNKVDIRRI
jgi:hypothetical protein